MTDTDNGIVRRGDYQPIPDDISLEDVFSAMGAEVRGVLEAAARDLPEGSQEELANAFQNSRPGKVWNENVVIARVMSATLSGRLLDDRPYEDYARDARLLLSGVMVANGGEFTKMVDQDSGLEGIRDYAMDSLFDLVGGAMGDTPRGSTINSR